MVYSGTWLVLLTLTIIIVLFLLGVYWAYSQNQFDDVEAAKYAMFENDREYQEDEI
jgi:nitrogen fixation-related uncharacterized protein